MLNNITSSTKVTYRCKLLAIHVDHQSEDFRVLKKAGQLTPEVATKS